MPRTIKHLSPTSLAKFHKDPTEFYLCYLADHRPAKIPQTPAMAVGSSFDAFVKSYLHESLFGKGHDPRFSLIKLFDSQVESQNRDGAYVAGKFLFEEYKKSGCLADLMTELNNSVTTPRFELDISGVVEGRKEGVTKEIGPIVFMGKPDVFFTNSAGARVILDWKVNGYYSKYNISPMAGYIRLREASKNLGCHRECMPAAWNGMTINVATYLETLDGEWAQQLAIYTWLCGEDVGTERCISAIDQVVCKPSTGLYPSVRFAEHRLRIGRDFQFQIYAKAQEAWEIIHSDHYFRDVTKEESQTRCKMLDTMFAPPSEELSANERWIRNMMREGV